MSAETLHKRFPHVISSILSNKTHIGGDKTGMRNLESQNKDLRSADDPNQIAFPWQNLCSMLIANSSLISLINPNNRLPKNLIHQYDN
jgi:hypothetical protein